MGSGMMLLVKVSTKRTSEHLHIIGSALALRTWFGLSAKLQAEAARNGQNSAGRVALGHLKPILYIGTALERGL